MLRNLVRWSSAVIVVGLSAVLTLPDARAQYGNELISEASANQVGLHRAWYTRAQASPGVGRVESVVYRDNLLLVQTRSATLQAIDAETGRTLWVTQVGKSGYETLPAAADKDFVAVTNGERLYVLRRATGDMVWQERLKGPPNAGCAVGDGYVFVPLIDGKVSAYLLRRTNAVEADPVIHYGVGAARTAPFIAKKHVYWTTEAGDLYVDAVDSPMARNRFRANGPIMSPAALWSPRVFVTSLDGYCYALKDDGSTVLWRFAAASPIRNMPVPVNDAVYVVSEADTLFQIATANGEGRWALNGVSQFLAASATRLYVADAFGRLLVLDAKTGNRLGAISAQAQSVRVTNFATDRIFLATEGGTIVCLREPQQTTPLVHAPAAVEAKPTRPANQPGETPATTPTDGQTPPADAAPNPFG